MNEPNDAEINIDQNLTEIEPDSYDSADDNISVDKWGNEWDASGDFDDMDFRLVDD